MRVNITLLRISTEILGSSHSHPPREGGEWESKITKEKLCTNVSTVTKTTPSGGMPMVKDNASSVTNLGH